MAALGSPRAVNKWQTMHGAGRRVPRTAPTAHGGGVIFCVRQELQQKAGAFVATAVLENRLTPAQASKVVCILSFTMQVAANRVSPARLASFRQRTQAIAFLMSLLQARPRRQVPLGASGYVSWADDTWIFATSAEELSYMVQTIEEVVARMASHGSEITMDADPLTRDKIQAVATHAAVRQSPGDA